MLYQTFHAMTHAISEINIGRLRILFLFCFYFDFAKGLAKAKCGGV